MAILLIEDYIGRIEAIPRYSGAAAGDLVGMDNAKVNAVDDAVKGIIVDAIPTDTPPAMLKLAGKGCLIEDTVMDGVATGSPVWSDGDGTYSLVKPAAGAADSLRVLMGYVRRIDTRAADTGCDIELVFDMNTDGAT